MIAYPASRLDPAALKADSTHHTGAPAGEDFSVSDLISTWPLFLATDKN